MNNPITFYLLCGCCAALVCVILLLLKQLKKAKNKSKEKEAALSKSKIKDSEEKILLNKIEQGFENQEFKMYLQFLVDSKTKKLASAEALSRWKNSTSEVIFPGQYIPVMEKSGLIAKFDYYMFEMVCKKLSQWHSTEFSNLSLSCNFTRITISEKDFLAKIKNIADKYSFNRSRLLIEITEDSIEKNLDIAKNNILMVKELGFGIALDDMGSGFTSLVSLCEYPIDVVKVDREMLLLANDKKGAKLLRGIISLAHFLNLGVVC